MDKLTFSLSVAGIGFLVVFVGLVILIFCMMGITFISKDRKKKTAEVKVAETVAPVAPIAPVVVEAGIPAEVIAAISAAVSMMCENQNAFVVRHVKRVSNAPAWNKAGREEQVYSRY